MKGILKKALSYYVPLIDRWLDRFLPCEDEPPEVIHRAMRYSVFSGGKRLRPIMVIEAFKWAGGKGRSIYPIACAIELIHAYSLIHDDLPAMDDDDFRRGKPSCHRAFGEAIAILAGDALHALAFELLARAKDNRLVSEVARAIGTGGLVGGQVVDIELEGRDVSEEDVRFIHERKTAALFVASVRCGAITAGASPSEIASLTKYARKFGLAFQITDDILNITGSRTKLGKSIGSDEEHGKATYPRAVGLKKAKSEARKLIEEAKKSLLKGHKNDFFCAVADFVLERDH